MGITSFRLITIGMSSCDFYVFCNFELGSNTRAARRVRRADRITILKDGKCCVLSAGRGARRSDSVSRRLLGWPRFKNLETHWRLRFFATTSWCEECMHWECMYENLTLVCT